MAWILLLAGMALSSSARADFELTAPDGRRVLLKNDGTWRYVEGMWKDLAEGEPKDPGEAVLSLERKLERGNGCRLVVRLLSNLPYEIRSLVPYYAAYRANGVIYDTVPAASAFTSIKPGDNQIRDVDIKGIACQDIARVQVVGGDRCEMGDLTKFTEGKGRCLALVRVVPSELVRFDK